MAFGQLKGGVNAHIHLYARLFEFKDELLFIWAFGELNRGVKIYMGVFWVKSRDRRFPTRSFCRHKRHGRKKNPSRVCAVKSQHVGTKFLPTVLFASACVVGNFSDAFSASSSHCLAHRWFVQETPRVHVTHARVPAASSDAPSPSPPPTKPPFPSAVRAPCTAPNRAFRVPPRPRATRCTARTRQSPRASWSASPKVRRAGRTPTQTTPRGGATTRYANAPSPATTSLRFPRTGTGKRKATAEPDRD